MGYQKANPVFRTKPFFLDLWLVLSVPLVLELTSTTGLGTESVIYEDGDLCFAFLSVNRVNANTELMWSIADCMTIGSGFFRGENIDKIGARALVFTSIGAGQTGVGVFGNLADKAILKTRSSTGGGQADYSGDGEEGDLTLKIVPVPESTSAAMLVAGLLLLFFRCLRRFYRIG